jgi:hypothetical protein
MVFSNGFNAAMISANDGRALGSLHANTEGSSIEITRKFAFTEEEFRW